MIFNAIEALQSTSQSRKRIRAISPLLAKPGRQPIHAVSFAPKMSATRDASDILPVPITV